MDHKINKTQLLVAILALLLTILGGAGATIFSYGKLSEKVVGLDGRLERIERLLDSRNAVAEAP